VYFEIFKVLNCSLREEPGKERKVEIWSLTQKKRARIANCKYTIWFYQPDKVRKQGTK